MWYTYNLYLRPVYRMNGSNSEEKMSSDQLLIQYQLDCGRMKVIVSVSVSVSVSKSIRYCVCMIMIRWGKA